MVSANAFAPVAITSRSDFDESIHFGAVVGLGPSGSIEYAIGDPHTKIYPRSSNKPMQAVAMVRAGFRMILESEPDFTVVGEAADGADAVQRALNASAVVIVEFAYALGDVFDGVFRDFLVVENDLVVNEAGSGHAPQVENHFQEIVVVALQCLQRADEVSGENCFQLIQIIRDSTFHVLFTGDYRYVARATSDQIDSWTCSAAYTARSLQGAAGGPLRGWTPPPAPGARRGAWCA